ncbi:PREDICTED: GRIP and coiled-coil domain-containing protein 1-like, partial [Apaloderma vittatum]|uniref:GRIP and coiled-coil domain-containing protein 1-like n=1 Tax=Apaloderma vittatum TaxID=57397 RepID=UPI0005212617
MEKFGMNFGGGPSKKDLLETIESQKKQLLQYQVRLKDVVRAYKSLLKEKEALEASLKVLSVSHEADRRVLQLKTQLATLTSALSTVTQEKSRMEASYQADKKKMKQDLDDAIKKAEEDTEKLETELKCVQEQLAETKARLITQQHDRAQEQSDHAVMLREL